jgi:hypothetical protein
MIDRNPIEPPVLRYQEQRGLNDVPVYATGLQLTLNDGTHAYLALSPAGLAIYSDGSRAVHYDLEGRLLKVADPGQFWRRSLSGRMLHTRKLTEEEGGGLDRTVIETEAATEIIAAAQQRARTVAEALRDDTATVDLAKPSAEMALRRITPVLELAASFESARSVQDANRFREIYGRVAVLPPDQYNALVLQATEGCAYAGCTFCRLYNGVPFRKKSPEEFRRHIREAIQFHGSGLRARRSIFLGEANALTQPTAMVKELLRVVTDHFELPPPETPSGAVSASWWMGRENRFDGVSSFLDAFTNPNRTANDYFDMRRAGLRRVYVGLETGDPTLLKWLRKPATPEAVLKCVRLLKENDIIVGVIVLIGAGGRENYAAHVRETVRVLNELPLGSNDYVYFSPLVIYPGSQYDTQAMTDVVTPLSEDEMRKQEQDIRLALRFDARHGKPYLARYELETFVY